MTNVKGVATTTALRSIGIAKTEPTTHQVFRIINRKTLKIVIALFVNHNLDRIADIDAIAGVDHLIELHRVVHFGTSSGFDPQAKLDVLSWLSMDESSDLMARCSRDMNHDVQALVLHSPDLTE